MSSTGEHWRKWTCMYQGQTELDQNCGGKWAAGTTQGRVLVSREGGAGFGFDSWNYKEIYVHGKLRIFLQSIEKDKIK